SRTGRARDARSARAQRLPATRGAGARSIRRGSGSPGEFPMKRVPLLLFVALAGCKSIGVDLGTQQPLKVDIAMKLDVYQHGDGAAPKKTNAPVADVTTTRRNRLAEIQALKDQRLVGENHAGYVELRNAPPGKFGEYVRETVDDENADRGALI